MNLSLYLTAALLLALLGGWFMYDRWQAATERADKAEAALVTQASNEKVVVKYVDKIVRIPGPAVVRDRIVRMCDSASLPSAGSPNAAIGADPGTGSPDFARRLAADLVAAQRNRAKLDALQEVLRPQVGR